uniref:Uncharacterized protein n=1 Tax=Rhizophora mucronata TaxID=61149 RepID=A0A2P2IY66_RHIMU
MKVIKNLYRESTYEIETCKFLSTDCNDSLLCGMLRTSCSHPVGVTGRMQPGFRGKRPL